MQCSQGLPSGENEQEGWSNKLILWDCPTASVKDQGKLQTVHSLLGGVWISHGHGKELNLEGYAKVCLKQSVWKGVPEHGNTMCTGWGSE